MPYLKIRRHFSLGFLGEAWKEGYLDFEAFTANDIKSNAALVVDKDNPDPKAVEANFDQMLRLLSERFIEGKIPTEDGKVEPIKGGELGNLPLDIIQEALSFLSQTETRSSSNPSEKS